MGRSQYVGSVLEVKMSSEFTSTGRREILGLVINSNSRQG